MEKSVDIVAGGQFGDEGKGQIAAWMTHKAMESGEPYHYAVRVGGSNAEHRFTMPDGRRFTSRVLPTAGWIDPDVRLVLGPGHVIRLDSFLKEVDTLTTLYGDQVGRIFIDPNAGVIDPDCAAKWGSRAAEAAIRRGSTHQGVGATVAHKVLRDGTFRTAKDYPELEPFVDFGGVWRSFSGWMAAGLTGLFEGSQGALLSLDHGYYPYCTSKNVTPAGMLAEAGLPIGCVRSVIMVYRAVPMRVPGNSGPTGGKEISWDMLEEATGLKLPESVKHQTDSGNRERVFLWSWDDFQRSITLCGPTGMVLTFGDWWPEPLTGYPIDDLIAGMQARARCPVVAVRHGPGWGDYLMWPQHTGNEGE